MFVKFCGLRCKQDIITAIEIGVSAVGFIFYKKSKRYVSPDKASHLSHMVSGSPIAKVGVFVDASVEEIKEISSVAGLDYIQIYDHELIPSLRGFLPMLIAYRIRNAEDIERVIPPEGGDLILLDSYHPVQYGGTGTPFKWEYLKGFPYLNRTVAAGGIDRHSLPELLRIITPFGIDVSSGIELEPGIKSDSKMKSLISTLKEVQHEICATA
jgi:phosphoribosylanthranilate isomerase